MRDRLFSRGSGDLTAPLPTAGRAPVPLGPVLAIALVVGVPIGA